MDQMVHNDIACNCIPSVRIAFRYAHISFYTTLTNFSTIKLVLCKVYTDVGGIKKLYHVCPPVRKIIHSLKLVDYLHVQADNPWYNYYLIAFLIILIAYLRKYAAYLGCCLDPNCLTLIWTNGPVQCRPKSHCS